MAQTGRRFPAPDRELWTKDLSALPTVSEDSYHSGCRAKDPSERQRSRACRLTTEAHCSPSLVRTNTCDSQLGLIHVLSSCFRSQKKSGRPYVVCLTFETDSGAIVEAACECPAGCSEAWSHILAAMHLLALKPKGLRGTTGDCVHAVTTVRTSETAGHQASECPRH
ncbi:uncharacterized protein LOC144146290 [Haemaphysalis longicornis]